jgi:hypothetical protein
VQALAGFNVFRLAHLTGSEITEAIDSVGGGFNTRLAGRQDELLAWAETFWRVRQVYGSFRQYVRSFEIDGFDALISDMKQRFPGLSPEFLTDFLKEAGEKTPVRNGSGKPTGQRGRRSRSDQSADGTSGNGNTGGDARRRGRRGGNAKAPAAKPSETPAKTKETPEGKAPAKSRRNRRRFFRRRDGKAKSSTTS